MRILSSLIVSGVLDIDTINNAAADTDKFLVADANGIVKFRTGAEVASDIGASVGYVSTVKHEVKLGEAIAKGQAVYVTNSDGTNMIVSKASNGSDATSSKTFGLLETGGATNDKVFVITEGLLAGLDTSLAVTGDPVWLGTAGNLLYGVANKPVAPAHMVFIGIVTRVNANNGEIFVKVQNGFELEELHNVLITGTPVDKAVIQYDTASGLWKNSAYAGVLASGATTQILRGDGSLYTFPLAISSPTNGQVLKYNGTSWVNDSDAGITGSGTTNYLPKFTGASTLGNSAITDDGTVVKITSNTAGNATLNLISTNSVNSGKIQLGGGTFGATIEKNSLGADNGLIFNSYHGGAEGYTFQSNGTNVMKLTANGRLLLGSTSDTGELLQVNGTMKVTGASTFGGTITVNTTGNGINLIQSTVGSATYYVMQNTVETGGKRYRFGYTGASSDKGSFSIYNETDNITPFLIANNGAATFSSSVTAGGTITQTSSSATLLLNRTGGTTFGAGIKYQTSGTNNWIVGTAQATVGTDYSIYNYSVGAGAVNITYATNNVQIGSTTDAGFKLDVNGTFRASGAATFSSSVTLSSSAGSLDVGGEAFVRGNGSIYKTHDFTTGAANVAKYIQRNASGTTINLIDAGGVSYINGGNFGIGMTPSYKLDVTGQARVSDALGVGISAFNTSAIIQADSTTKGFLPPRMTATQRAAISTPAEGLIVVQTDGVSGLYIYIGSTWRSLTMV